MLSRDDFKKAIIDGRIKIYPFNSKCLTGIGYNLSTTYFAFSINRGILLTVHQKTTSDGLIRYINIPANDTILLFSKEYIEVDNSIAGTFHSKVSRVCQGLGHISTTLDPTWKGQLIISVNNPTSKSICYEIDKTDGNIMTMLLYKMDMPVTGSNVHDNNQGRCDVLLEHFTNPPSLVNKKYIEKHFELQEFITKEFSNSLNGDDSFLHNYEIQDCYSKKIEKLIDIQRRMRTDWILFNEARYVLGENGYYCIIRNEAEKRIIRECAIYSLEPKEFDIDYSTDNIKGENNIIKSKIEAILRIIEYELEMIEHIRRIEWQNSKIIQFAGEASDFVLERNRRVKKQSLIRFWIPLVTITLLTLFIFVTLIRRINSGIIAIVATIYAPILTFALQWWFREWKNSVKMEDNE